MVYRPLSSAAELSSASSLGKGENSMNETSSHYRSIWESYWGSLSGKEEGEVFWDSAPATGAAVDLSRFQAFASSSLPLIDVGCGNGTQTRFFAGHFRRVIGVDVSEKAVLAARERAFADNIEYRVLDLLDPSAAEALHREIGDANVYIRAVLHQLSPESRPLALRSVEALLGSQGVLYLIELSPTAEQYFGSLIEKHGQPPPGLARVLQHGIKPATLAENELMALFPEARFELLAQGDGAIRTTHPLPEGGFAEVPAVYRVLKLRSS
jgi:SAM-dependent methyltransferase